ncbi:MAG: methyl-accepting chemotaxis protein [Bacillota bacterium]
MKLSKLLKITGSIILILLILVGGSVYYLNVSFREERQAVEKREELKGLGREMVNIVNELSSLSYKYIQTSDTKYSEEYLKKVNETKRRAEIVDELKQANIPQEELDLINQAVDKSDFVIQLEKAAIKAVDSGNVSEAKRKLYDPYYARRTEDFKETIDEFQAKVNQRTEKIKNKAQDKASIILLITNILIAIVVIEIIVVFILLYKRITGPINKAVAFANKIASGNLNATPLKAKGKDEIAELSESLNEMQDNLKDTIARILDLTKDLSSYSQEISEVDEEINYAFDFIKDVKKGNEETADAVDEISLSIREIAKGTEELSVKAEDISDLGQETFELVKKTDDKINSGTNLVNKAVDVMEELSTSVSKVDQISERIMNIADETNLLSLDGAIEAADGEGSGGGFGAVADDIKDLADESMAAAKEVKEIVKEVKDVTNRAINIMIPAENSNQNIADVFAEIEGLSNDLITKVENVTEATEDQVASTEQISASTEEISAASEEVSGQADEMYENVKQLENIMSQVAEFNQQLRTRFKSHAQKSKEQLESINVEV